MPGLEVGSRAARDAVMTAESDQSSSQPGTNPFHPTCEQWINPLPPSLHHPQVKREATRVDPAVSVSSILLFSPQSLQDQYHKWMFQIPAVRQVPLLCVLTQLVFCVRFLVAKAEDECGWAHVAAYLPGTALAIARLALSRTTWEFKSLLSVVSLAYTLAHICAFRAFNDTFWMNVAQLPEETSLYGYACITIAKTVVSLCLVPCTMHHLEATLWVVGFGAVTSNYIGYLQNNGGLTFDSDPDLLGFQTIAASTVLCLLAAAAIRYWLARKHMTAFLKSIRRTRIHYNERR